jgi:hypothetical protein
MALLPVLANWREGHLVSGLINLVVLVGGVVAVARTPTQTWIAIILAVVCAVLQAATSLAPNEARLVAYELMIVPFYLLTMASLLAFVLRPGAVGVDRLYAAVSVYILAGFLWGLGYFAVSHWSPGSFLMTIPQLAAQPLVFGDLLYFSFVSLTSTGYGDIVPVTALARVMTVFEHIAGVMYVAILIARLAGMRATTQEEDVPPGME